VGNAVNLDGLRIDSRNWFVLVNLIHGRPHKAGVRVLFAAKSVPAECGLRVWIHDRVAFNFNVAVPTLFLAAKWTAEFNSLIVFKIVDVDSDNHVRILIQILFCHTKHSGGMGCAWAQTDALSNWQIG
jgi:hypothetical protein